MAAHVISIRVSPDLAAINAENRTPDYVLELASKSQEKLWKRSLLQIKKEDRSMVFMAVLLLRTHAWSTRGRSDQIPPTLLGPKDSPAAVVTQRVGRNLTEKFKSKRGGALAALFGVMTREDLKVYVQSGQVTKPVFGHVNVPNWYQGDSCRDREFWSGTQAWKATCVQLAGGDCTKHPPIKVEVYVREKGQKPVACVDPERWIRIAEAIERCLPRTSDDWELPKLRAWGNWTLGSNLRMDERALGERFANICLRPMTQGAAGSSAFELGHEPRCSERCTRCSRVWIGAKNGQLVEVSLASAAACYSVQELQPSGSSSGDAIRSLLHFHRDGDGIYLLVLEHCGRIKLYRQAEGASLWRMVEQVSTSGAYESPDDDQEATANEGVTMCPLFDPLVGQPENFEFAVSTRAPDIRFFAIDFEEDSGPKLRWMPVPGVRTQRTMNWLRPIPEGIEAVSTHGMLARYRLHTSETGERSYVLMMSHATYFTPTCVARGYLGSQIGPATTTTSKNRQARVMALGTVRGVQFLKDVPKRNHTRAPISQVVHIAQSEVLSLSFQNVSSDFGPMAVCALSLRDGRLRFIDARDLRPALRGSPDASVSSYSLALPAPALKVEVLRRHDSDAFVVVCALQDHTLAVFEGYHPTLLRRRAAACLDDALLGPKPHVASLAEFPQFKFDRLRPHVEHQGGRYLLACSWLPEIALRIDTGQLSAYQAEIDRLVGSCCNSLATVVSRHLTGLVPERCNAQQRARVLLDTSVALMSRMAEFSSDAYIQFTQRHLCDLERALTVRFGGVDEAVPSVLFNYARYLRKYVLGGASFVGKRLRVLDLVRVNEAAHRWIDSFVYRSEVLAHKWEFRSRPTQAKKLVALADLGRVFGDEALALEVHANGCVRLHGLGASQASAELSLFEAKKGLSREGFQVSVATQGASAVAFVTWTERTPAEVLGYHGAGITLQMINGRATLVAGQFTGDAPFVLRAVPDQVHLCLRVSVRGGAVALDLFSRSFGDMTTQYWRKAGAIDWDGEPASASGVEQGVGKPPAQAKPCLRSSELRRGSPQLEGGDSQFALAVSMSADRNEHQVVVYKLGLSRGSKGQGQRMTVENKARESLRKPVTAVEASFVTRAYSQPRVTGYVAEKHGSVMAFGLVDARLRLLWADKVSPGVEQLSYIASACYRRSMEVDYACPTLVARSHSSGKTVFYCAGSTPASPRYEGTQARPFAGMRLDRLRILPGGQIWAWSPAAYDDFLATDGKGRVLRGAVVAPRGSYSRAEIFERARATKLKAIEHSLTWCDDKAMRARLLGLLRMPGKAVRGHLLREQLVTTSSDHYAAVLELLRKHEPDLQEQRREVTEILRVLLASDSRGGALSPVASPALPDVTAFLDYLGVYEGRLATRFRGSSRLRMSLTAAVLNPKLVLTSLVIEESEIEGGSVPLCNRLAMVLLNAADDRIMLHRLEGWRALYLSLRRIRIDSRSEAHARFSSGELDGRAEWIIDAICREPPGFGDWADLESTTLYRAAILSELLRIYTPQAESEASKLSDRCQTLRRLWRDAATRGARSGADTYAKLWKRAQGNLRLAEALGSKSAGRIANALQLADKGGPGPEGSPDNSDRKHP